MEVVDVLDVPEQDPRVSLEDPGSGGVRLYLDLVARDHLAQVGHVLPFRVHQLLNQQLRVPGYNTLYNTHVIHDKDYHV